MNYWRDKSEKPWGTGSVETRTSRLALNSELLDSFLFFFLVLFVICFIFVFVAVLFFSLPFVTFSRLWNLQDWEIHLLPLYRLTLRDVDARLYQENERSAKEEGVLRA